MKLRFILFALVVGLCGSGRLLAFSLGEKHVAASLVAERTALVPGRTTTVALRLVHDEHWHTYWKNPGEAGLPTTLAWTLPPGFSAGPIQWPAPEITDTGGVLTYGYGGDLLLLVEIAVPADARPGENVALSAEAEWLMCKEACVPGEAKVSLTLPVAPEAAPDAQWAARIATARAALPQRSDRLEARAFRTGRDLTIRVSPAAGAQLAAGSVGFFADDGAVDAQALQSTRAAGEALEFSVRQAQTAGQPKELTGLLVAADGWWSGGPKAVAVQIPVTEGSAPAVGAVKEKGAGSAPEKSSAGAFSGILALAFFGGLILNLMPCVFPVLGIKILGFVQQAGAERGKVRAHGLAFAAGVLASFWVLAGVLLALRAGGAQLGWGYQLQVPGFVFVLTIVMLVFALSLSGVFEIGGSLIGAGVGLQSKSGYAGSFFSGVLATVVATPCSAPFLAPALGAAIVLPPVQSLAAFTAIALGLAAPYLVLSFAPALVKVLPRPGAWMETFKQFMAFPLYATAGYLVYVLAGQVGDGLLEVVLGLTLIAMAGWVIGRWATLMRAARVRWIARGVALALFAGGIVLGLPRPKVDWVPWSPETVAKLRAQDRIVYVDFTARWCVTCQANKAVVFGSAEVNETFRSLKVAKVRGDWTSRDPQIAAELQRFGRAAVPVTLVYVPGRAEPLLLPEVLTPGTVLDAVRGKN
ncbi:MAG TPA: protein-disulfide reductase DsbD domain-containing protein [Opitutaceae bacterium]|nr:protein-disulfide reductase DsbD domain-containing protein [Opitutaceae bacterium]